MMKGIINTTVYHYYYGKGEVEKVTEDKIYVLFGDKRRIFSYPGAFEKGYLSGITETIVTGCQPQNDPIELTQNDIKHHIMVIKINQLYKEDMDPNALYSIVRGIWRASKERAQKMEYVFGIYQSQIVAVYKPTEWFVCKEARDKLPRKDIVLSSDNENRIFFRDATFEEGLDLDENQRFYLGKSIVNLTKNMMSQNPISYLNPKKD